MKKVPILGLLLAPVLGYPLLAASLFLCDVLFGGGELVYFLHYDQRRLWDTFWADYLHAFPAFYVGAVVLVATYLLLRWATPLKSPVWLVALGTLAGVASGGFLEGRWIGPATFWVGLPVMLASALLASLLDMVFNRRSRPR